MGDLLIRGMEMPKGNDAVTIIIFPNGKVSLAHDRRFAEYAEAVPIPPHGRLVDVDAVILDGGPYEYDEWCKWALERYQDAPTVIPASE